MRVIAGTLGGRRLIAPAGRATRPTSELVRGAVFNSLGDRVVDAIVADLFAGTGAMGIEALSRGAAHAHFVESDRRAVAALQRNLRDLDLAALATVHVGDVLAWVGQAPAVHLALADPPYGWDRWPELLQPLAAFPGILVVAEADRALDPPGWQVAAVKRHGGTVVSQLRPRGARL